MAYTPALPPSFIFPDEGFACVCGVSHAPLSLSLLPFRYAVVEPPRTVDGMVLSKFDTIDNKVGAAVSMSYSTGKPIIFVGTGQKYTNLRRLNVDTVLEALFAAD
jgi:hypothetical protein